MPLSETSQLWYIRHEATVPLCMQSRLGGLAHHRQLARSCRGAPAARSSSQVEGLGSRKALQRGQDAAVAGATERGAQRVIVDEEGVGEGNGMPPHAGTRRCERRVEPPEGSRRQAASVEQQQETVGRQRRESKDIAEGSVGA